MDLALAHTLERDLVKGDEERLPPRHFAALVAQCRAAKERLLGPEAPDDVPIALAMGGSKLVGQTRRATLARSAVEKLVLEGFFPEVDAEAPLRRRGGIRAFGLPFEREVAITRHVAAFLRRHADGEGPWRVDAVLFNGGVFQATALAHRVLAALAGWCAKPPVRLEGHAPLSAVALGAVSYGLSLRGGARRIGGGSARAYFLGVGAAVEARAVCVLPKGCREGEISWVDEPKLQLTVGTPVRFDLYAADKSASGRGDVVKVARGQHLRLPPLVATLEGEAGRAVEVALEAQLSALGTLELACVDASARDGERFELAFDLRAEALRSAPRGDAAARYGKRLEEAEQALERVFGKQNKGTPAKEVRGITRELERIFGKRSSWSADLTRALYDRLWAVHKGRRSSADHERQFWSLAGFCLRPGIGDPRDADRVKALFRLFEQRLAFPKEARGFQQFWIAQRRIAAGLPEPAQVRLRGVVDPFLAPAEKKLKRPKGFRNDAQFEMLDLAASLERLPAAKRGELGGWILERTWTSRDARLWAALGRVGARVPTYASAHCVVAARTVERWMDHLLRERWEEVPTAARAALAMCRLTGDRERDVRQATRDEVRRRLVKLGLEGLCAPLDDVIEVGDEERSAFYGEDLPAGLHFAG